LHVFLLGVFFPLTNSQRRWFSHVPREISVRDKIPSGNILAETSFLTVISRETLENHIFENKLLKKRLPMEIRAMK
jgi:hypothetical protein